MNHIEFAVNISSSLSTGFVIQLVMLSLSDPLRVIVLQLLVSVNLSSRIII